MPEMWFEVRWPDERQQRLYSPSLVISDDLTEGISYAVDDFLARARTALGIASDRVQAKYGFPCSRSAASLAQIGPPTAASRRGRSPSAPLPAEAHAARPAHVDAGLAPVGCQPGMIHPSWV